MKIIDSFMNLIKRRASTNTNPEQWFVDYFKGGQPTKAGVAVNNDTALQLSTYFACVRNISEDIAKLPLNLYKPIKPQGKEKLQDHPLYRLLHYEANGEMSAMTFRETLSAHALNWGNGFAFIERKRFGEIVALWPLRPDRVKPYRKDNGQLLYEITDDYGAKEDFQPYDILHIHGLGFDGVIGYNVARYAREGVGSIKAAEEYGAKFFANGSISNGILEIPAAMKDTAKKNLAESFQKSYGGSQNSNKMIVLEEGVKFNKTSIPPEEAQFLETRQFSVPEICRWFRMPPNKVADTTRAQGWSTLEQLNTDYVNDCLMPWFVNWEQEIYRRLLTVEEKKQGLFAKHVADALLRGDTAARNASYTAGRTGGWLSADDIRELEDMNPLPDGKGQIYLQPLNMVEAGTEPPQQEPVPAPEQEPPPEEAVVNPVTINVIMPKNEPPKEKMADVIREAIAEDCSARIAASEIAELEKHIKKAGDKDGFDNWLEGFYEKHERFIIRTICRFTHEADIIAMMMIANCSYAGVDFEEYKKTAAQRHKEFLNANL